MSVIEKIIEEFVETFSDIMLWTGICALLCIPGFGTIPAIIIIGGLKTMFQAICLDPIARILCQSAYNGFDLNSNEIVIDLIRIWLISYILVSVIRIIAMFYYERKAAKWGK